MSNVADIIESLLVSLGNETWKSLTSQQVGQFKWNWNLKRPSKALNHVQTGICEIRTQNVKLCLLVKKKKKEKRKKKKKEKRNKKKNSCV